MSFSKSLYSKGYRYWMRRTLNGNFIDMVPYKAKRKPAGNGWVDITTALFSCCDKPVMPTIDNINMFVTPLNFSMNVLQDAISPGGLPLSIYNPGTGSSSDDLFTYIIETDGTLTVDVVDKENPAIDLIVLIMTDGSNYVPFVVSLTYSV